MYGKARFINSLAEHVSATVDKAGFAPKSGDDVVDQVVVRLSKPAQESLIRLSVAPDDKTARTILVRDLRTIVAGDEQLNARAKEWTRAHRRGRRRGDQEFGAPHDIGGGREFDAPTDILGGGGQLGGSDIPGGGGQLDRLRGVAGFRRRSSARRRR